MLSEHVYYAECPVCGMRSFAYDDYGYAHASLANIIRSFWEQHTVQACTLYKKLKEKG